MAARYPIRKEFFPFSHFAPPISERFLRISAKGMKTPRCFLKAKGFSVSMETAPGYDGAEIPYFLVSPEGLGKEAPCLVYIHGGGFVLEAAGYHYMNALRYASECGCRVVFPLYRLAPDHPFPIFLEDCYSVFSSVWDRAGELGIDRNRIGIGGDSAGSDLSVGVIMLARDRKHPVTFLFQMLPYPYLDARNNSESARRYTDTPMWNSTLSEKIGPMTRVGRDNPMYLYYSPVEASDFSFFPPAYIETAEFDCLHDDGILYAKLLEEAGVKVVLNETKGTMHGYDIMRSSPTALASMEKRIAFMKEAFLGA